MIYFDNAATSRFKPKSVLDALFYDVTHSANSSRSAHKEALGKTIETQKCRQYLLKALGGKDEYHVVFTKNCTEALNLAILGGYKIGERIVTTQNEHNSVLRPLYKLANEGKIALNIIEQDEKGRIRISDIEEYCKSADTLVLGGASNVTGAINDIEKIGKITRKYGVKLIVDGAQSVPVLPMDLTQYGVDMLALPAHKGLHGVQGVGALIVKENLSLAPLTYGGTGAHSNELSPQIEYPDSFEAGTQFSGGISALRYGAQWSFQNIDSTRKDLLRLSKSLVYGLKILGATIYSEDLDVGVVSFNIKDVDSAYIGDKLAEKDICVRCGLHCAPLVHKHLGTIAQGAVRVSFGSDNTEKEVGIFLSVLEGIIRNLKA